MATTGHENEVIDVQGLKASLQKLKTDMIDNRYTKTEVNELVSTPHQNYVTLATYAERPETGSADTIYRVSNWDGSLETPATDVTKYSEYAWNGTDYTFLCVKSQIGEVFDISEYHANTTYATLSAALGTNGENVPESLRKGGMSVKYVCSSDNKYVQYRLMSNAWSINVNDWYNEHITISQNTITLPDWVANTAYVIGNQVQTGSPIKYYRCTTAHTSGDSFDATNWAEITNFIVTGASIQSLNIGDTAYPIYSNCIKLSYYGAGSGAGALNIGEYGYITDSHRLICRINTNTYDTIPFFEGAIYTYDNELYVWNGSELVITPKRDDEPIAGSHNLVESGGLAKLLRGGKYFGVANINTVPRANDINIFYIACSPGVYTNFNNIKVSSGELCILYYNSTTATWSKNFITNLGNQGFSWCGTSGNESEKHVSLFNFCSSFNPIFIIRLFNINTANDVTINVNNELIAPLYYNGAQMSSTNCPNYKNANLLVLYNNQSNIFVSHELFKSSESLGYSDGHVITQSGITKILFQKWKEGVKVPISLHTGFVNRGTGAYTDSNNLVITQCLSGLIDIKVKSPYVISSGAIYDGSGNYVSGISASDSRDTLHLWVEPFKYAILNIRNIDSTLSISPNDDIIEYYYSETGEKNIVDGYSMSNIIVKELYLIGLDEESDYYISSISKNHGEGFATSLYVKERVSGDIVAMYRHEGWYDVAPTYIELIPQNNSGISGYAVMDWDKMKDGELITDSNQYSILDDARHLEHWELLSIYVKQDDTLDYLTLVADDGVIHTAWNYILRDVTIDETRYLQFSNNLGKTYSQAENTYGDIVYVHFFSNGVCLFATATKCYYFSDITNIQESALIDYDGSSYVSNCILDFFQNDQSRNDAMIVDGKEIVAWGSYSLAGADDPNYVGRVWYSPDYGQTIKCAIKFGTTVISGEATPVRHTHGALYNKYNQKFIIITGDYGNQCQIIEGVYNPASDTWQFTKLGQGDEFKFGDVLFRDNFVYLVTDYTLDASILPRGILRCPYEMLNDYSKYQYIYKIDSSYKGSLIGTLEDDNGNKLLFPDGSGRGNIWYCKHNLDFITLPLSENVVITNVGSPNYNGDIYARKSQGSASFPFKLDPMVNLTKSMRTSGCKDFFVQNNVLM